MGKGVAKDAVAKERNSREKNGVPVTQVTLDQRYGLALASQANGSAYQVYRDIRMILVPTKDHWRDPSPLWMVEQSVIWLATLNPHLERNGIEVAVPPMGCGNGGLDIAVVQPIMAKHLGDQFILIIK